MPSDLKQSADFLPVAGVRLAAVSADIYADKRLDLALLAFDEGAVCSAMFTQNAFCAAPVQWARQHRHAAATRYCLVNAGNANAGTGERGLRDARHTCQQLAVLAGCEVASVLPFSTGVIGEYLPAENICAALPELYAKLAQDNWEQCARAIMTTDTIAKGISRQVSVNGEPVTTTGIAKGAGMICPDMATMLAFIATDASVRQEVLDLVLERAVRQSFNRICVDGDTSTNDAVLLVATGKSGGLVSALDSDAGQALQGMVNDVCHVLAQAIIRDGEGASKFITVNVIRGADEEESLQVARTVATSPLVKTAFFASDPNWGRLLAAIGRASLKNLDISAVKIYLNDLCLVENGQRAEKYHEAAGMKVMAAEEITLIISLGRGEASATIWTCDLSHDYIKINAEYRT